MRHEHTSPATTGRRAAWPLAAAVLTLLAGASWPTSALAHPISHRKSSNWAGYADTAGSAFTGVSARWVQPAASCAQPYATYSAFWVGLGGFKPSSQALEQIGTEADCARGGRSTTYAWYELVPAAPVKLKLAVNPGNVLSARVSVHDDHVALRIENLTTHHTYTKTVPMHSPDQSSAEWITEAPSECLTATQCHPLPLADFGTVSFSDTHATTTRGKTGTIIDPAFRTTELTLSSSGRMIGPGFVADPLSSGQANPGTLTHEGDAFTVTYKQTTSPTRPMPPLEAPAQLRRDTQTPPHATPASSGAWR